MHVEPRDGESFDQMLRRFKTNSELQRDKAKAAARRRTRRPKVMRGPRPQR